MTETGFRRRVHRLTFDADTGFEGMVVRVTACSVDENQVLMTGWRGFVKPGDDPEDEAINERAVLEFVAFQWRTLIDHVIDWNIQEIDGRPVPVTMHDLKNWDAFGARAILTAWRDLGRVRSESPLAVPSDGGPTTGRSSVDPGSIPRESPQPSP